jgi:hypothetical protein
LEEAVYILCTVTALACCVLLLRGYARAKVRLLLWTGLFFLMLTLENALLLIDRIFLGPSVDLGVYRGLVALVGVVILLFGLIWEKR